MSHKNVDVAGPVDVEASLALVRPDGRARDDVALRERAKRALANMTRSEPAIVDEVRAGRRRVAFTFAGQGALWFDELVELYAHGGHVREIIDAARDALVDERDALSALDLAKLPDGVDAVAFIAADDADKPDAHGLARASMSAPWTFVVQMARVEQVRAH